MVLKKVSIIYILGRKETDRNKCIRLPPLLLAKQQVLVPRSPKSSLRTNGHSTIFKEFSHRVFTNFWLSTDQNNYNWQMATIRKKQQRQIKRERNFKCHSFPYLTAKCTWKPQKPNHKKSKTNFLPLTPQAKHKLPMKKALDASIKTWISFTVAKSESTRIRN